MALYALGGRLWGTSRRRWCQRTCVSRLRLSGLIVRPPLDRGNGAGEAIATYLDRQDGGQSLIAVKADKGERAMPKRFRISKLPHCCSQPLLFAIPEQRSGVQR